MVSGQGRNSFSIGLGWFLRLVLVGFQFVFSGCRTKAMLVSGGFLGRIQNPTVSRSCAKNRAAKAAEK